MSYLDYELSDNNAQPIEGYEFIGTYAIYRYTSADVPITINGHLYSPIPCERSNLLTGTQVDDNVDLTIVMPATTQIVLDYAFNVAPPDLMCNVYRVHRGSNYAQDWILYWTGRVHNFSIEDHKASLSIPSTFGMSLAGNVPTSFYQTVCNHVLFDSHCKVNRALFQFNTTILAINGLVIRLAAIPPFPDQTIVGGQFLSTVKPEQRMIMTQTADIITLNYRLSAFVKIGDAVQVSAGCDHNSTTCQNKFNNKVNFGGFPFIPNYNPFTQGF